MLPDVELCFLGPPLLRRAGQAVSLDRKPTVLLAWLAVNAAGAHRATLAALLWPDSAQAGVNLRKALWQVRQALGEASLTETGAVIALDPTVWNDVAAFAGLLGAVSPRNDGPDDADRLAHAVDLYRGDFLDGLSLPDSLELDDWQALHRERLALLVEAALDRLARAHCAAGRFAAAVEPAMRRVALMPESEAAHLQVAEALAWSGRPEAALRHLEGARQTLVAGGLEPGPRLDRLADDIAAGNLVPPVPSAQPGSSTSLLPSPAPSAVVEPMIEGHLTSSAGPSATRGPAVMTWAVADADAFLARVTVSPSSQIRQETRFARSQAEKALLTAVLDTESRVDVPVDQLSAVARIAPLDLTTYRLSRIAAWCRPRYRLDRRFVALTLLVDRGEAAENRWLAQPERYDDLGGLLDALAEPALVVLGAPGSGKSTLLRRLELDLCLRAVRGTERGVSFHVSLNGYGPFEDGAVPAPLDWLADRWRRRHRHLPDLSDLLAEGRLLLLLDGLNEMPHRDAGHYRALLGQWKAAAQVLATGAPGNRMVFTCRSLDYSAPLSSPGLRVPQARLEPLSDAQVAACLHAWCPEQADALAARLSELGAAEAIRTPFFLRLLADQARAGEAPADWPGLLTGLLRRSLQREVERDNPLFVPDGPAPLITERDHQRLVQATVWAGPYDLPERGPLLPGLVALAYGMQAGQEGIDGGQVQVAYDRALALLDHPRATELLRAGTDLGVLDDDPGRDVVQYSHQLVQEYFAARRLARTPEPERVRAPWQAADSRPPLAALLPELAPADTLPPLPATGWEESTLMAAAMSPDLDGFVAGVAAVNLPLAGRCVAAVAHRAAGPLLEPDRLARLRADLLARSRDPEADPRARIDAALALGRLGDPRFEARRGDHGDYLLPPLVDFAGGDGAIGDDAPYPYLGQTLTCHVPRHRVRLAPFAMGRFAVTNAEFACFIASGGYDDTRWWDTAVGAAWRAGVGTAEGAREAVRYWLRRFRAQPDVLEAQLAHGEMAQANYDLWQARLAMSEAELEAHLAEIAPDRRHGEPAYWRDPAFNNPLQPAVGICWYEARAYCRWLSAQTGQAFRLPSEAEWEWAAAGGSDGSRAAPAAGRAYAWGDGYDPLRANLTETRLRRTAPIGCFPEGDTPDGLADMTGNTWDWTASLWGDDTEAVTFAYPYDAGDGREDPEAASKVRRIVRGGSWVNSRTSARTAYRGKDHPADRTNLHGFRLACTG